MATSPRPAPTWRFGTKSLFLATLIIAIGLNIGRLGGPIIAVIWLGMCFAVWSAWCGRHWLTWSFVAAALIASVMPQDLRPRGPTHRATSLNNLRQLTLAIRNYEQAHGHLPPPYTVDGNGQPLHSWRVLILPYIEEHNLYSAIDLTKPWNHPDNLKLAVRMPAIYAGSVDYQKAMATQTTGCIAIIGNRTAWPPTGTRTLSEITDGLESTILVVESDLHRVHWMSPDDPTVQSVRPNPKPNTSILTGGPFQNALMAVDCSSRHRRIPSDTSFQDFLGVLIIDDGKLLPQD